jgi:hypothetical protein
VFYADDTPVDSPVVQRAIRRSRRAYAELHAGGPQGLRGPRSRSRAPERGTYQTAAVLIYEIA